MAKRIQCTVCLTFMDFRESRICSEECRQRAAVRNFTFVKAMKEAKDFRILKKEEALKKTSISKGQLKREKRLKQSMERMMRRESVKPNQARGKSIVRIRKKLGIAETVVKKQAEKIRVLKQGRQANGFFESREWQELRYRALRHYGRVCMCCGAQNCELHVDHIKPRSKFPELELEFDNLQVLCRACNYGKSNIDFTDWRPKLCEAKNRWLK